MQKAAPVPRKNLKKLGSLSGSAAQAMSGEAMSPVESIVPGAEVEHARFGKGKVISVEGAGASRKASVFFKNVGQKQLLLQYAKLRVIG